MPDIQEMLLNEKRCPVCALPLPRGEDQGPCSRRCMSQRALSEEILDSRHRELCKKIFAELTKLNPGATICPGELSRRILPDVDQPLRLLRPLLFHLQDQKKIQLSQKGSVLPWRKIRGPFRVKLRK